MRCLVAAVSVGLVLILVGAAPITNLKEDLKTAAEETFMLIKQQVIQLIFTIGESVIANRVADQAEIDKWQGFINQLRSRNESWIQDDVQFWKLSSEMEPILPEVRILETLNHYVNGTLVALEIKAVEYQDVQFAAFKSRATNMIRVAKAAGFTDVTLDERYNRFIAAKGMPRMQAFKKLLSYLKGLDLDE